jgi:glucose-1-phosphate thymidylyltransferase
MVNSNKSKENHQEVIGLIPAGGQATRIAPLPCSKELYPIGFRRSDEDGSLIPKVVCHYLLEKMRLAGVTKTYIVLRNGKWDIPAYLGDGKMLNMHLAYLMMRLPFGVPYTIDQAYPFVQDTIVAFGFPDIIFKSDDAFEQLLTKQAKTNADVLLGLFPVDEPRKWDMVDIDDNGRIRQIIVKPPQIHLRYTWIIAVWTPAFTRFIHEYLPTIQDINEKDYNNASKQPELFISDVIQQAIDNDLQVEGVLFPDSTCLDIGTPDDLAKAINVNN